MTQNFDYKKEKNKFTQEMLKDTLKYQKQYKFGIGLGEHDTWNNEADAFKHTFGSAYMAIKYSIPFSKISGDIHEKQNPNNPKNEENMDKWNNRVGRLIAKEIKKRI